MLNDAFPFEQPISLTKVIEAIKTEAHNGQSFCVYVKNNSGKLRPDQECYLAGYPTVDDNDQEVFPEFVSANKLELAYYGEQFEDVVRNARDQKSDASSHDFVKALNYYMENDDFLDF